MTILRISCKNLAAFTAMAMHPSLTANLFLGYAQHVLLDKMTIQQFWPRILQNTYNINRLSDIIHLEQDKKDIINTSRYMWIHNKIRPWGQMLLVQCKKCGCVRNWLSAKMQATVVFACKTKGCPEKLRFGPSDNYKTISDLVSGGRWLLVDEP